MNSRKHGARLSRGCVSKALKLGKLTARELNSREHRGGLPVSVLGRGP